MKKLSILLFIFFATLGIRAQHVSEASEKDYTSGEEVPFFLVQADQAIISRIISTMKGKDGDFENLKETTHWEGFNVPGIIGAVDITVTEGTWLMKAKSGKFTPSSKPKTLKEGEQYALMVKAIDNEGNDIMSDPDKRDELSEYLEKLAAGQ